MRLSAAFTALALVVSASFLAACNAGGNSELDYAPPTNFDPRAGLSPDLTNPNSLAGPSAPPFDPY